MFRIHSLKSCPLLTMGCWISPLSSGETRKLEEVEPHRTSFPPTGIRFQSCALIGIFVWRRGLCCGKGSVWACFIMVPLPVPLTERRGSFLDPRAKNLMEFLEGKAHKNMGSPLRLWPPGSSYSHTSLHSTSAVY